MLATAELPAGTTLAECNEPSTWRDLPYRPEVQQVGANWLGSGRSLALRVPSALVEGEVNVLLDPAHPGYAALQVMENHLKAHDYFPAGQFTVSDIALYAYTHVADRCDFDLATFPAIRDWLARVEDNPGFVSMDWRPADTTADA